MAQFYTLEEAARVLGMSPEELKTKAQRARSARSSTADRGGSASSTSTSWPAAAAWAATPSCGSPTSRSRRPAAARRAPRTSTSPSSSSASPSPTSAPRRMHFGKAGAPSGGLGRARHPARRPLAAAQPGDRVELGDHRRRDGGQAAERLRRPPGARQRQGGQRLRRPARDARPGPAAAERFRRHPDQGRHGRPRDPRSLGQLERHGRAAQPVRWARRRRSPPASPTATST